ncbi:MAG: helix-turn-helix domain-containing protein [Firmicutes bacterium]|nr:helix-turn-helix domain-containing protein [Bacillota bacterium]
MVRKQIDNKEIRQRCILLFASKALLYTNFVYSEEYKDFFAIKTVESLLKDEELVKTATLFFDNSLNISTASKVGFMHRNTLIYRLDKINKLIGLDIRNFKDAVVFENMLICYEKYEKVE